MEKFLLLVREDLELLKQQTPEELEACLQVMGKWVASLAQSGNYVSGEPLHTVSRYVTRDQVMSDGPFIEAKEAISGYFMIHAENIEQATSIAQTCPMVMSGDVALEVRPVMFIGNGV